MSQQVQTQTQPTLPNIGFDLDKNLKPAVSILIQVYGDQYVLSLKTWNYFYNVLGPRFAQVQTLLKAQFEKLETLSEATGLQIRSAGFRVPSVSEIIKFAKVSHPTSDWIDEDQILTQLLKDNEHIVNYLTRELERFSEQVKEFVIEDFLLDVTKSHRILAWTLRSHLERLEGHGSAKQMFGTSYGIGHAPQQGMGWGQQGMGYGQQGMGYGQQGMGYGQQGMGYGYGQPGMGYGQQGFGGMRGQQWGQQGMGYGQQGVSGREGFGSQQYGSQQGIGSQQGVSGKEGFGSQQYGSQQGLGRESQQGLGARGTEGIGRETQQGLGREGQQGLGREGQQGLGRTEGFGQGTFGSQQGIRGQQSLGSQYHGTQSPVGSREIGVNVQGTEGRGSQQSFGGLSEQYPNK